ncbi:MAG: hypothetical protein WD269_09915 [Acidimicrobiia bacterium]
MASCRFDVNCVEVGYQLQQYYSSALHAPAAAEQAQIESFRQSAYSVGPEFDLRLEGERFADLLEEIC